MQPAERFEDLIVWRLSHELSRLIDQMIARPQARRHKRLCEQIAASAASVPANLAEGFGRFHPNENAPFARIAKASLTETQSHLLTGNRRRCWISSEFDQAWRLSQRALKGITRYVIYLESCDGELPLPRPQPDTSIREGAKESGADPRDPPDS